MGALYVENAGGGELALTSLLRHCLLVGDALLRVYMPLRNIVLTLLHFVAW